MDEEFESLQMLTQSNNACFTCRSILWTQAMMTYVLTPL